MTVETYMTKDPVTAGPDSTAEDIARLLVTHRIGCVPLVDADGKLLGLITEREMFLQERRVPFFHRDRPLSDGVVGRSGNFGTKLPAIARHPGGGDHVEGFRRRLSINSDRRSGTAHGEAWAESPAGC